MKKAISFITILGISVFMLTGCQGTDAGKSPQNETTVKTEINSQAESKGQASEGTDNSQEKAEAQTHEVGGWKVVFEEAISDKTFDNVSTQLGYTDVSTSEFHKEASEGKKFCLVKLQFIKENSTEEIDFTKLKLIDENGNEYNRMEDGFISDLGMKRMPGTKLNFGSNDGWICYEVDEAAEKLTMEYAFAEETLSITIL